MLRVGPRTAWILLLVVTSSNGSLKAVDLSSREPILHSEYEGMPLMLGNLRITYPDTNFALDLAAGSSSNGTKIVLWGAHGGPNQSWIPEPLSVPDTKPLQNNSIYLV